MGPTPKLRHPRRAEGEALLRSSTLTDQQIATRIAVSREAVRLWRRELGLPAQPRGRRPAGAEQ